MHWGHVPFNLNGQMEETSEQKVLPPVVEHLGLSGYLVELLHGIGVMLGLALLWSLEGIRNLYFSTLDRWNIKARPKKRASAFPPGRPRRHKVV